MAALERENGTTPARRAISCSPSCQCMASAARHGMAISSATLDHISALNLLSQKVRVSGLGSLSLGYRFVSKPTSHINELVCSSYLRPIHFGAPGSSDNEDDS